MGGAVSSKAWHMKQIKAAVSDKAVAEKRQQGAALMYEAAAMANDEAGMKEWADRTITFAHVAMAAVARMYDQSRRHDEAPE